MLNAVATATVATLAGGDLATAARLGVAMLVLQASIGALNDVVDAPLDAEQKPSKPIPRQVVSRTHAIWVAVTGAIVGIVLSAPSGLGTAAVATGGLALGYAYDLRLSRTRWSWLPLSLALPLLPIHAWLGASGSVPPGLVILVPTAILAGAGLAIANGLVDVERDAHVGRTAIAVALGPARAWLAHAGLFLVVVALAVFAAPAVPPAGTVPPGLPGGSGTVARLDALRALRLVGVVAGIGAILLGALALRSLSARIRERGWELEALGVGAIGIAWLAGTASSTGGGG